ncbi:MAG TPA: arsenate reductase (glutaredoxin), partial [Candidatus Sulfotelmatobacter sp.]|nr:arsenate reductase (glutaredoxin) [Candidatus Sulfotelmatobacter sp.]
MAVTIYHNPRCSKSRQTLALLRSRGIEPRVIEYLDAPPTAAELDRMLKLMGREPREAMRRGEAEYKALRLDNAKLTRQQLIAAMAAHPKL